MAITSPTSSPISAAVVLTKPQLSTMRDLNAVVEKYRAEIIEKDELYKKMVDNLTLTNEAIKKNSAPYLQNILKRCQKDIEAASSARNQTFTKLVNYGLQIKEAYESNASAVNVLNKVIEHIKVVNDTAEEALKNSKLMIFPDNPINKIDSQELESYKKFSFERKPSLYHFLKEVQSVEETLIETHSVVEAHSLFFQPPNTDEILNEYLVKLRTLRITLCELGNLAVKVRQDYYDDAMRLSDVYSKANDAINRSRVV